MVNEFDGLTLSSTNVAFASSDAVLRLYDMEDASIAFDLGILLVNVVVFQVFLFLVLQFLRTGKH